MKTNDILILALFCAGGFFLVKAITGNKQNQATQNMNDYMASTSPYLDQVLGLDYKDLTLQDIGNWQDLPTIDMRTPTGIF